MSKNILLYLNQIWTSKNAEFADFEFAQGCKKIHAKRVLNKKVMKN
jgi:hypothetical protein